MARTLRVALLAVRLQHARRYHVTFQVLSPGQAPAGVVLLQDTANDKLHLQQVARTETSQFTPNPEFANRVFILRLVQALTQGTGASCSLQCNVFAAPCPENAATGAIVSGREVDQLMGCATVQLQGDVALRLLQGQRVALPVMLSDTQGGDGFDSPSRGMGSSMFGAASNMELLIELQLLDVLAPLPRDAITDATLPEKAPANSKLLVLVSHAENLPTVRRPGGGEQNPSTFVAARSLTDVNASRTPQAVTNVCQDSCNPHWGEVLQVNVSEDDLSSEELHLSVVNDLDSRLVIQAVIPMSHITPGSHYNLKLLLPGGPLGSHASLYVTLFLTDATNREARHIKTLTSGNVNKVLTASLGTFTPCLHVFATQAVRDQTQLVAGSQVLGVWTFSNQPTSTTDQQSLDCDDVYHPIEASSAMKTSQALAAITDEKNNAIQAAAGLPLEIYPITPLTRSTDTIQRIGDGDAIPSSFWPDNHLVTLYHTSQPGMCASLALHVMQPGNRQTIPMGCMHITPDQLAALNSRTKRLEGLPLDASKSQGCTADIEVSLWDTAAYQEHLQKPLLGEIASSGVYGSRMLQGGMTWQSRTADSVVPAALLEQLVDDVILKQAALLQVIRAADQAESQQQIMAWRLNDSKNRNTTLAGELQQVRQILHEEKESQRIPTTLENSATMCRDDLVNKAELAIAAYNRERRRNAELVHRLQQMHSEQVDMLEIKKRYMELQTAHMEATRLMGDTEGQLQQKMMGYRSTIKTQEQVIANLESLLAQTAAKVKEHTTTSTHAQQQQQSQLTQELQQQIQQLREDKARLAQQQQQLQQQLQQQQQYARNSDHAMSNGHDRTSSSTRAAGVISHTNSMTSEASRRLGDDLRPRAVQVNTVSIQTEQSGSPQRVPVTPVEDSSGYKKEILSLKLSLKQAEDRTAAARSELINTIKRYASEISELKCRLAEKDAQLMGGFGSAARLLDMEDPLGLPRVNVNGPNLNTYQDWQQPNKQQHAAHQSGTYIQASSPQKLPHGKPSSPLAYQQPKPASPTTYNQQPQNHYHHQQQQQQQYQQQQQQLPQPQQYQQYQERPSPGKEDTNPRNSGRPAGSLQSRVLVPTDSPKLSQYGADPISRPSDVQNGPGHGETPLRQQVSQQGLASPIQRPTGSPKQRTSASQLLSQLKQERLSRGTRTPERLPNQTEQIRNESVS